MKARALPIKFHKNPVRRHKNDFLYVRYTTLDRRYAVEKSEWQGAGSLRVLWRALKMDEEADVWDIIDTRKTRKAAERAVRLYDRSR